MNETEHKLNVLSTIAEKLNEAGVTWDIGASLSLYLRGITDIFHDIDITTTTEDALKVKEIFDQMGTCDPSYENARYHTKVFLEYQVDGGS